MFSDKAKGSNLPRLVVCVFMGIALLGGFSSPALTAPAEDKSFAEYFEGGKAYLEKERFEEAARKFKESLRLNPRLDEIDEQVVKEAQAYLEKINIELKRVEEERHYREGRERLAQEKRAARLKEREQARRLAGEERAKRLAEREEARRLVAEERAEARRIRTEERARIRAERERAREEAARERAEERARRRKEREEKNR
ncbi:hypothetical protein LR003_01985 [candidate division NPL-UPA2 bacterium]|nr:hypothetical protein [candidate division NPL-UPA2 bacterium]